MYATGQAGLANSGDFPGLSREGEAGEILRGVRDSFIARDDFARGDDAYGAGKVAFTVLSAIAGTKGVGAVDDVGRGAVAGARSAEVAEGALPEIALDGGLPPAGRVPEVNPSIPKSVLPDTYKPYGDMHPYRFGEKYWDSSPDVNWWRYPEVPRGGFAQKPGGYPGEPWILDPDYRPAPGTRIDRIGGPNGKYFAPEGTPFDQRSLPPTSMGSPYNTYTVTDVPLPKGWRIELGPAAPYFEQGGGGLQLYIVPPSDFSLPVVKYLKEIGFIE